MLLKQKNVKIQKKWWLFAAFFLLFTFIFTMGNLYTAYTSSGPNTKLLITIPKGLSYGGYVRQLKKQGYDFNIFFAKIVLYLIRPSLKYGEFELPAGTSLRDSLEVIETGRSRIRMLTIREGSTSEEICQTLLREPGLEGTCPVVFPEGSVFPETYGYSYGQEIENLIEDWQKQAQILVENIWKNRDKRLPLNSVDELVILASIVEKETSLPEEKPLIAAVFLNRLKKGMRLQADPTVLYGIRGILRQDRQVLTRKDLAASPTLNPYNTYKIKGLPPTAICHPSRSSLEAAAHPSKVDFLYFVADGTGGHAFSTSLKRHRRHHAQWRRIRKN